MDDAELLQCLIEAARKQSEADARIDSLFDDYAAGRLTDAQIAELLARAKESPELTQAEALFRPLGPHFEARLVDRLLTHIAQDQQRSDRARRDPAVVSLRRHPRFRPRTVVLAGALAALAAAIALVVSWPTTQHPALPGYGVSLQGYLKTTRVGPSQAPDPGELPRYRAGSTLTVILRPERAVKGPIDLATYLETSPGSFQRLELSAERDPQGSMRLRAVIGKDLGLAAGTWTLWINLARPGRLVDPQSLPLELGPKPDSLVLKAALTVIEHDE